MKPVKAAKPANKEKLIAVGVDGARGGWIAAAQFALVRWQGTRTSPFDVGTVKRTEMHFFAADGARSGLELLNEWRLAQPGGKQAPVAVDVPIGLGELGGSRPCDVACRAALPGKSSSVFPPPARFLIERFASGNVSTQQLRDAIYERRAEETRAGRAPEAVAGMSTQSCAIFDKIWETDRFVRDGQRPDGSWPVEDWLFEVHPELSFQHLHDTDRARAARWTNRETVAGPWPQLASKKSARGLLQRLTLVGQHFTDVQERVRDQEWSATGTLDDPLDAYAALWTARRVAQHGVDAVQVLGRVPGDDGAMAVPRDNGGKGLLMRMVV